MFGFPAGGLLFGVSFVCRSVFLHLVPWISSFVRLSMVVVAHMFHMGFCIEMFRVPVGGLLFRGSSARVS